MNLKWTSLSLIASLSFPLIASAAQALNVQPQDLAAAPGIVNSVATTVTGAAATVLTDGAGLTLYTFEKDTAAHSNCSGRCLQEWPPQHVPAGVAVAAPFGVIQGNDGQPQLTLDGAPLYHYDDDKGVGDTFGQYPAWDVITVQ